MDARSSDDAMPSTPPEPAGAPSTSQPHSPTRDDKQAQVRDLLASLDQRLLNAFRPQLENAFSALKLQNEDRDILAQDMINMCQLGIGTGFRAIVNSLSALGPDGLPPWLARRIFITPSQNRRDIIPADDLFEEYSAWCTSNEEFDFDSAITQLLNSGLQAAITEPKEVDEMQYHTYARSFDSHLHGDVVQRFNDTLSDYEAKFDPDVYYGRIIPIVQSSGTGKSRLVHEMRTIWPTLSVTLRKEANSPEGGFPIQDIAAVDYFKQQEKGVDYDLITIAFLAAWFKIAADNIPDEPRTVQAIFDENWVHSVLKEKPTFVPNEKRKLMFDMVASEAALFVKEWKPKHRAKEEVEPMVKPICDPLENLKAMFKQLLEPPLRQFAQKIGSLKAVKQQTKQRGFKKPLVLIAIDECTLLSEFLSKYKLVHLRRCFRHIGTMTDLPVSVWLLLLDTSTTISKLWPTQLDQKSLREHTLWQFLPFYEMGFDVLEEKAKAQHPRDALKLDTLKYYGRPLWQGYDANMVLKVACLKLDGSAAKKPPGASTEPELSEALAVSLLSNRICLDLVPLRSNQNGGTVVTTTVERHMRIIVDFDDTGRIGTRALSEPMLAIATWYWLSDSPSFSCSWPNVIKYMRDHLLHSESVDMKGVNGEVLVRLLLVLARDSTDEACQVRELYRRKEAPDMPAIPFQSFLSALLGKSASELVLAKLQQLDTEGARARKKKNNKRKCPSPHIRVAKEERQCWVNFTHVTQMVPTAPQITSCFLWEAWKRGAAIQCARGQARIDGILPIYRGSLDDAFNNKGEAARRMTYMAWQVKNRDKGTKSTECMHGPLIAHPAKEAEEPMFTLLFEVGTESAFQQDTMNNKAHPKISVSSFKCTEPSCCSRSKLRVVRVRGCEAKVYPCLEHWKVGREFGDMVRRVSDRPISKGKTIFDGALIYEVDDDVLEEPA
ncbi:hypothetical protein ACQY0O_002404 [Thecaphora frezii]